MGAKLVGVLFCLLFAVPFGGVGVFATWAITGMVKQSNAAADWVLVKATVDEASLRVNRGRKGSRSYEALGRYRYTFDGKPYFGTQLGLDTLGSSTNLGDWDQDMAAYLIEAKEKGQAISLYVNPDNPAQSVVDRGLRWGLVGFLAIFGIVFGSVGVGALVAAGYVLVAPDEKSPGSSARKQKALARKAAARAAATGSQPGEIVSDAGQGVVFVWIVAFFWNLIAFPAAFATVPKVLASGDYWVLFVLLFPLVGLLLLYSALHTTWGLIRRGNATLRLEPETPRGGQIFTGTIRFPRGVSPGTAFDVRLQRQRVTKSQGKKQTVVEWSKDVTATASQGPEGTRLVFRLGAPAGKVPRDRPGEGDDFIYFEWRIEVRPAGSKGGIHYGFPIRLEPKAGDASLDDEVAPEEEQFTSPQSQSEALFGPGPTAGGRFEHSSFARSKSRGARAS
jgi:hypothetical protein